MTKSFSFKRPMAEVQNGEGDAWVNGSAAPAPSAPAAPPKPRPVMKRLTLDIPEDLHRRVKSGCAARGEKIADVVRRYLDDEFPPH